MYYILLHVESEKLNWSDAVIFEAVGNKIEYQTEVDDDKLLEILYEFTLERIDLEKLN